MIEKGKKNVYACEGECVCICVCGRSKQKSDNVCVCEKENVSDKRCVRQGAYLGKIKKKVWFILIRKYLVQISQN